MSNNPWGHHSGQLTPRRAELPARSQGQWVLGEMSFRSSAVCRVPWLQPGIRSSSNDTRWVLMEAIPHQWANKSLLSTRSHAANAARYSVIIIHLMSSQLVWQVNYRLREFSWSGEQAEQLTPLRAYYAKRHTVSAAGEMNHWPAANCLSRTVLLEEKPGWAFWK